MTNKEKTQDILSRLYVLELSEQMSLDENVWNVAKNNCLQMFGTEVFTGDKIKK